MGGGSNSDGMAGIANLLGASGSSGGADDISQLFKSLSQPSPAVENRNID